jgi:hypothetical protein
MMDLTPDDLTMDELMSRSRDEDPFSIFSEDPDGARSQVREALLGRYDAWRDRLSDHLVEQDNARSATIVEASLMTFLGIDPIAVCLMSSMCCGVGLREVDGEDPDEMVVELHAGTSGSIRLTPGVSWHMGRGVLLENLPETTTALLAPGPLSGMLSHPALDALDLQVTRIEDDEGGGVMLIVDEDRRPLAIDQLMAFRPSAMAPTR